MPWGDMTGPLGEGPYTGRRGGRPSPRERFGPGWGGRGMRFGGRGMGRGGRGGGFLFGRGGRGRAGGRLGFGDFRNVGL